MQIGVLIAAFEKDRPGCPGLEEERIYQALVCAVAPANQAAADLDRSRDPTRPVAEEPSAVDEVRGCWCPWKEYRDTLRGQDLPKDAVEAAMKE